MARNSVQRVHGRSVASPCHRAGQNVPRDCGRRNRTCGERKLMATSDTMRHYAGDVIDISYDVRRCIHAAECIRGLPAVFDSSRRPWIVPSAASADAIADVIARCPSGALHFTRRDGGPSETPQKPTTIEPTPGGPYHVRGLVELRASDGTSVGAAVGSVWVRGVVVLRSSGGTSVFEDVMMALCRCGQSHNKPFCDNSHFAAG